MLMVHARCIACFTMATSSVAKEAVLPSRVPCPSRTDSAHVGMFALRERRIHVTQEDFEMAVTKVMRKDSDKDLSIKRLWT
jgi:hypothetical protein